LWARVRHQRTGGASSQGDPPFRPAAIFRRGEGSHRPFGSAWRDSIAELCHREGIVQNLYYRWSKEFLEAGKKRLAGTLREPQPLMRSRSCAGRPAR